MGTPSEAPSTLTPTTNKPSLAPTRAPTEVPTPAPTLTPTDPPTQVPQSPPTTATPTEIPSPTPTDTPTEPPTPAPTLTPTTPVTPTPSFCVNNGDLTPAVVQYCSDFISAISDERDALCPQVCLATLNKYPTDCMYQSFDATTKATFDTYRQQCELKQASA